MASDDAAWLLLLLILILLSAFFSCADTALKTANRIRLQELSDNGSKQAGTALLILENRPRFFVTQLSCLGLVNGFLASLAAVLAVNQFGFGASIAAAAAVTILILVPGGLVPRAVAAANPERAALACAPVLLFLMRIARPLTALVSGLSQLFLRAANISLSDSLNTMTELELRTIVDASHQEGVLEKEERQMIYNVVDFGDAQARDVMVPRADMVMVSETASYEEVWEVFHTEKYTRLPVYREDQTNITGILNIKDFFFCGSRENFRVTDVMYDPYFTFEYKKTSELLVEMRHNSVSISIVLDEYGASVGMISLEDLLEEIVGEIRDEYDEDEKDLIQAVAERTYQIEGSVRLDDINDVLHLSLVSEDHDSIGGLIIEKLDHLPVEQESVTTEEGITLTVLKMDKNRIDLVQLILPESDIQPSTANTIADQRA